MKQLPQRFEKLIAELFRANGFTVEEQPRIAGMQPDLLIRSHAGATAVVEVKLYHSRTMPTAALAKAAAILEHLRRSSNATRSILVVGCHVSQLAKNTLKEQFTNLIIYGVDEIAFLLSNEPNLNGDFDDIIRETFSFSDPIEMQAHSVDVKKDISEPTIADIQYEVTPIESSGKNLCDEIMKIPTGKAGAKKFEEKTLEALKYIFKKDLVGWQKQNRTNTGLSIFDAIARVISKHDFWKTVVDQFRSRYIVFEFKNYTDKIKQGQIFSTEKYLFIPALRSVAIIISRNGADDNALAAARGALRESGKLIVNISVSDLCEMLELKDSGDDPNSMLMERVDEMLMKLER
jgi:hypothetical protein